MALHHNASFLWLYILTGEREVSEILSCLAGKDAIIFHLSLSIWDEHNHPYLWFLLCHWSSFWVNYIKDAIKQDCMSEYSLTYTFTHNTDVPACRRIIVTWIKRNVKAIVVALLLSKYASFLVSHCSLKIGTWLYQNCIYHGPVMLSQKLDGFVIDPLGVTVGDLQISI